MKRTCALNISSGHCESNTGQMELQSTALPTELYPAYADWLYIWLLSKYRNLVHNKYSLL